MTPAENGCLATAPHTFINHIFILIFITKLHIILCVFISFKLNFIYLHCRRDLTERYKEVDAAINSKVKIQQFYEFTAELLVEHLHRAD